MVDRLPSEELQTQRAEPVNHEVDDVGLQLAKFQRYSEATKRTKSSQECTKKTGASKLHSTKRRCLSTAKVKERANFENIS
jgi:hypothetical protein